MLWYSAQILHQDWWYSLSCWKCYQMTAFTHQPSAGIVLASPKATACILWLVRARLERPSLLAKAPSLSPLSLLRLQLNPALPISLLFMLPCRFLLASLSVHQNLLTIKSDVKSSSIFSGCFFSHFFWLVGLYCFLKFGFISINEAIVFY